MGIGALWDHIGEGEVTNIAEYAAHHHETTGRPFRIAIDTACWVYNNVTNQQTLEIRASSGRPSNPMEKAILYRLLRLLQLGIQVHFVFDGPKRPQKRGRVWKKTHNKKMDLLQKTFDNLGISSHIAVGEAEADCAAMQQQGIVDAVWTEDGDAFMFGCTHLIRFNYEKKSGKDAKSNTHFRLYRSEDIPKQLPGLDREGFVLYCILNGGDYDEAGLHGIGLVGALKAAENGLGKSLCKASEFGLKAWREELVEYFKETGTNIMVPPTFPKWQHLRDYRQPLLSDGLASKWQQDKPVVEGDLKPFLQEFYNFQAEAYVTWIVPMLLVRTLMQTSPGQERSNDFYELEIGKQKDSETIKASFLLSATTSLNMGEYAKMDGKSFCEADFRGTCETLRWVLHKGVPDALAAFTAERSRKPSKFSGAKGTSLGSKTSKSLDGSSRALVTMNKRPSSEATGKKRGRPPKDTNKDKTSLAASNPKTKRAKVSEDSDLTRGPRASAKFAEVSSKLATSQVNSLSVLQSGAQRGRILGDTDINSHLRSPIRQAKPSSAMSQSSSNSSVSLSHLDRDRSRLVSRQTKEPIDLVSSDVEEKAMMTKPSAAKFRPKSSSGPAGKRESISLFSSDNEADERKPYGSSITKTSAPSRKLSTSTDNQNEAENSKSNPLSKPAQLGSSPPRPGFIHYDFAKDFGDSD